MGEKAAKSVKNSERGRETNLLLLQQAQTGRVELQILQVSSCPNIGERNA
jgi:hypothetical protein